MKSLITTFCIAALCWVAVPGSAYSQDDTISAEDFDAAVAAAVADAIEGLAKQEDLSGFEGRIGALETSDKIYTQDDPDAAVASATDGMYTQEDYDAATEGMYTQAEYDAATVGMYTQAEYDTRITICEKLLAGKPWTSLFKVNYCKGMY